MVSFCPEIEAKTAYFYGREIALFFYGLELLQVEVRFRTALPFFRRAAVRI
jgi:hypothetical protein